MIRSQVECEASGCGLKGMQRSPGESIPKPIQEVTGLKPRIGTGLESTLVIG